MDTNLPLITRLLEAAADPNRLRILRCLGLRPACVCELVQATGIPQPRLSRHLKVLREAGLVEDRREAQWVEYSLVEAPLGSREQLMLALVNCCLEDDAQTQADRQRLTEASRALCALTESSDAA